MTLARGQARDAHHPVRLSGAPLSAQRIVGLPLVSFSSYGSRAMDIGSVEDNQGNWARVRWDNESRVVEVRVFRFPADAEPFWDWVKVGISSTASLALMTAQNWARGVIDYESTDTAIPGHVDAATDHLG
jgi:hypothetical protein